MKKIKGLRGQYSYYAPLIIHKHQLHHHHRGTTSRSETCAVKWDKYQKNAPTNLRMREDGEVVGALRGVRKDCGKVSGERCLR